MECVDVPILNDTLYEGHETFEVVMSAVSGTLSNFTSSSAVVTILEDDASEGVLMVYLFLNIWHRNYNIIIDFPFLIVIKHLYHG